MPIDDVPGVLQPARGAPPRAADLTPSMAAGLADEAAHGLARAMPELSAHVVVTRPQMAVLAALTLAAIALAFVLPDDAWSAVVFVLSAAFTACTLFRAALAVLARPPRGDAPAADDGSLPLYTIIVPLFREANVLPRLARALLLLDYPAEKLDIKIVVEAEDEETVAVAQSLAGRGPFEILVVPEGKPQTKPRACNYALHFARGDFTVIYDAEDRPERDQLRKAVAAFRARPAHVACLQARLSFYNAREAILTRLFELDYAVWYEVMLPALDRLGVPMPLGGTSNHFRTDVLRRLGGWDPFNVTEDADLGIRIAQLGMRVSMLDSTTFEEAPARLGGWFRQRSRWMKGYMQTWLVHTRRPAALAERAGLGGFFAFHLFIGGSVAAALATPLLWLVFLSAVFTGGHFAMPLGALAGGNVLLTILAVASPIRRGGRDLSPYGIGMTLYWAMISLAAWRGLYQLVTRPFYWEKTVHGLSRPAQ
jgi:cellulose synthase/poly-beta-1,6-N-acetylglucosamine synthase-like glycosyltransferase